jgi:hypothetical protein
MKLFAVLLFSLFFVSTVSFVYAQELPNVSQEKNSEKIAIQSLDFISDDMMTGDPTIIYAFAQIIQRDSSGALIGYIQDDNLSIDNFVYLDQMLDVIEDSDDLIFSYNGAYLQMITQVTPLTTDPSGLLSTINFSAKLVTGETILIASLSHDGMRINLDETVDVIWTFIRYV